MNIFEYIQNDDFFKPLTSIHHRLYYDCIRRLIDQSKSVSILYESSARKELAYYLQNQSITAMDEETGTELTASMIIARFRACGWIGEREIGRSGEYVLNITTNCRRIMDFLFKMTEKSGQGEMSNRIFAMYEIVRSAFDEESARKERPYTNILVPLLENEAELKNELSDLKDHIAGIMKAVIAQQDMQSLGQFILKDEMLERFFTEYFFIKNNGMIPSQLSYIKERLRWLRDDGMMELMIDECAEKLELPRENARVRVESGFSEIQVFLSEEYEDHMELIDHRINIYYSLANTRVMLMSSNGLRLDSAIHDFLIRLADMDADERAKVLNRVAKTSTIYPYRYIGTKSFEKKKEYKRDNTNIELTVVELTDEEKENRTKDLFLHAPNAYSLRRVSDYLKGQMGDRDEIHLKDMTVREKKEALMYAAAMMYDANEEFGFHVEIRNELIETPVAQISDLTIRR